MRSERGCCDAGIGNLIGTTNSSRSAAGRTNGSCGEGESGPGIEASHECVGSGHDSRSGHYTGSRWDRKCSDQERSYGSAGSIGTLGN